jgi:hypothetical protein
LTSKYSGGTMVQRAAEHMVRWITVVVAAMVLTLGGGASVVPAQASQTFTVAMTTADMQACTAARKKAAKLNKRFKRLMKKPGTPANLRKVMAARGKHLDAVNRAGEICNQVPIPEPRPETLSGHPRDPRPKDWVRPADGSGLPGSVFEKVQISPNCPVTISRIEMAEIVVESGHLTWVVTVFGENYSPSNVNVHFTIDVINGRDGSNWNAVPSRGWVGTPRMVDRQRELNAWEEWQFSTVVNKNRVSSPGDLDPVLLGATLTCLDLK